ncbi:flagellar basal body-associated FliL family protein [Ruegeria sp. Ofav3-42]|uniref:flagellar basal body-associated FliL family protein n=1 Tax=Ruegeria sp. Ofav3-42 TaxID=2917759 RepID=UPI001EF4D3F8|nr:flagellar basal body-associated FliL family protein [Ruegeria sp. Ofav3-42]MCG7521705.1 flagellar basal body-associated FliL family protein [Ruegeria sp. Ofav3-42]
MIKKLIPFIFLLLGLGGGIATGLILAPSAKEAEAGDKTTSDPKGKKSEEKASKSEPLKAGKGDKKEGSGAYEYLKLTKQFVIPVVESDRIAALVTMSLSLEVTPGMTESLYAVEPKLRDRFLQVLFDHANTGGFDGNFTQSDNLDVLRKALLGEARKDLGDDVSKVLIMSVSRQDT